MCVWLHVNNRSTQQLWAYTENWADRRACTQWPSKLTVQFKGFPHTANRKRKLRFTFVQFSVFLWNFYLFDRNESDSKWKYTEPVVRRRIKHFRLSHQTSTLEYLKMETTLNLMQTFNKPVKKRCQRLQIQPIKVSHPTFPVMWLSPRCNLSCGFTYSADAVHSERCP